MTPPSPAMPHPTLHRATADTAPEAARLLAAGAIVGLPTETVYGLAADATNPEAIARVYAAKGRPAFNPLIAHVASLAAAEEIGILTDDAVRLAARFWPGPLTLVVPARPEGAVCELARAGLPTVAIRVPEHPFARAVLRALGKPVAAPSANLSGHVSATTAEHVVADFGARVDAVFDAGAAAGGLESTIVGLAGPEPVLLRAGAIPSEAIERALGRPLGAKHYAPRAAVRLDAERLVPGETGLAFAGVPAGAALDLSPTGDLVEAAARLYAHIRALDASGPSVIAVGPIPDHGLGEAIRDRLARAALGR
jgi:L-threonylcarbamoyladenylate synthase